MYQTLNKTTKLVDFIDELAMFYDIRNNQPSKMILVMLSTAIKLATNINDKAVVEASLKSISLYDFLMTFAVYYDSINELLTPEHKKKIIDKIETIVRFTRCKKIQ